MKTASVLVVLIVLCSCSTEYVSVNGEKPPRYASDVQVARFESENRAPTTQLEMFLSADAVGQRHYRIIALLTREGHREDEGLIMNAIGWRARQLGAEGLIPASGSAGGPLVSVKTSVTIGGSFWSGDKEKQSVFRACAIVFTPPQQETGQKP